MHILAAVLVLAGFLIFALANVHLVYVAIASQPDCVPHLRQGGAATVPGAYVAARSAC